MGCFGSPQQGCPGGRGSTGTSFSESHRLHWVAQSMLSCGPECGVLWVALSCPCSRSEGLGWSRCWMAPSQASSTLVGSRAGVEHRLPLACTHCGVLEPDPRTLGPRGLVRRPGAGAHSGGVCSLQTSGSLPGSTALLTAHTRWWFHAGYGWQAVFSRHPLPFLIENYPLSMSDLLIQNVL
uniref:Uncharacterized protein n=1 Tax=Myotis myotis TaxID=51298 RepID=A0A7J7Z5J5_MYOMY|nr:hypothetical protein mMyoMyo1_010588 [Myotis myotis]